jgi:hypothetical protein
VNVVSFRPPTKTPPTKIPEEEQADAILTGRTWELAVRYFGEGDLERLAACMTVTREDLRRHVDEHGYPEGWWRFEAGTEDGLYTVPSDGEWIVYLQERGKIEREYPGRFRTRDEAVDFVLESIYLKRWRGA